MSLGVPELLIILAVVLLLFGATRLPKLARSLGDAKREFEKGTKGDEDAVDRPADKPTDKKESSVAYLSTNKNVPGSAGFGSSPPAGTITGVIVDDRGYIVTTGPVADSAPGLTAVLSDGRRFTGTVVRHSPDNDIVVVKIDDAAGL